MGNSMNIIEMDHTSSGVQIAAALSRDDRTASVVNINGGDKQTDMYAVVYKNANARLAAAGSKIRLGRSDVKTAVIATIYGGTKRNSDTAFAEITGLQKTTANAHLFACLSDAIAYEMSGVVTVQRYIRKLIDAIHAAGHDSVTFTLANGAQSTVRIDRKTNVLRGKRVRYTASFGDVIDTDFDRGIEYYADGYDVSGAAKTVAARFIQSFDAAMLACTQTQLAGAGVSFLAKHDAYLIDESDFETLRGIVQRVFFEFFSVDRLAAFRSDLVDRYGIDFAHFDAYGSYDVESVLSSKFLLSE